MLESAGIAAQYLVYWREAPAVVRGHAQALQGGAVLGFPRLYRSNRLPAALVGRLGFFATRTLITPSIGKRSEGRPVAGAFFAFAFLAFLAFGDSYFNTL